MVKFDNKVTIISILVGVIGIASTVYSTINQDKEEKRNITFVSTTSNVVPISPKHIATINYSHTESTEYKEAEPKKINGVVHLLISATGADVKILEGDINFPYSGGVISSTGAEQIIYLPKNQALSVTLSGTGAELSISRNIAKQVNVINSGTGADVSVF